jgi:L-asparaginase
MVLVAEQRVYAARDVIKGDARPGGFILAGGHGGILAGVGHGGKSRLLYVPASLHTWRSQVNLTQLPQTVSGLHGATVAIKDADGALLESAIPKVSIVKDASYYEDEPLAGPETQVDILAWLDYSLKHATLAGFAVEGLSPYGKPASPSRARALLRAVYSGLPVVFCGRGNTGGFAVPMPPFIAGSNLAVTKARLLLMACLMKFGTLPAAADPTRPTAAETAATLEKIAQYQAIFDTH